MQLTELDPLPFQLLRQILCGAQASTGPLTLVGLRPHRREHAGSRHSHAGHNNHSYKPSLGSTPFWSAEPCSLVDSAALVVHQTTAVVGLDKARIRMAPWRWESTWSCDESYLLLLGETADKLKMLQDQL